MIQTVDQDPPFTMHNCKCADSRTVIISGFYKLVEKGGKNVIILAIKLKMVNQDCMIFGDF